MNKVRISKSTLVINVLIATFIPLIPTQATIKQQPQNSLRERNNTYLSLSWSDVWKTIRRPKTPGVGKGPICVIVPTKTVSLEIWSLQPLFLWDGKVKRIELFEDGSESALWSREITPGQTSIIYDGKPLQPGKVYGWKLHAPFPIKQQPFQIMEQQQRDSITNQLAHLKQQKASGETMAQEKTKYFADKELWSDALRVMYGVPNPSEELTKIKQEISSYYCPQPKNQQSAS